MKKEGVTFTPSFVVLSLGCIDLFDGHWFLLVSQYSCPVCCDEVVEFVAQACETLPCIEFVVADEVCELFLCLPLVDEFGNEIDTRLDREHESRLKRTCQSE